MWQHARVLPRAHDHASGCCHGAVECRKSIAPVRLKALEHVLMSEYQYYEFLAVDHALTERQMDELRAISTRADITPTSFVNVYNWGDLKANPAKLLARYFDVHVYVTNWGTRRLMLRLPAALVDAAALDAYNDGYHVSMEEVNGSWIVDLYSEDEEAPGWEDGEGWMASLAPVREELLRGDMRPLYLVWLLGIQFETVEESDPEPPVPPGLRRLSAPQERLAEFLRLDPSLIEAAAAASMDEEDLRGLLAPWIAALPAEDKDRLLLDLAEGRAARAQAWLSQGFRKLARDRRAGTSPGAPRRTARSLQEAADAIDRAAEEREERARQRREAEAAAMRVRYLEELAPRQDELWRDAERLVASRKSSAYPQAIRMLQELHDLSVQRNETDAFAARLAALQQRHGRKSLFMAHLRKAGLAD